MKIAVCGSAGIGKTTLVDALAKRLNIKALDEHYGALFSPPGTFAGEPERLIPLFFQILNEKHEQQQRAGSFVVDRVGLDLFNLWMARGLARFTEPTEQFARVCKQHVRNYDLLVFPPWGVLTLVPHDNADGRVRVQDPWVQLRNHAAILGMARLWAEPHKIVCLSEKTTALTAWVDQVSALVDRSADAN